MMEQQVNYPCETLIAFPQVDRHDQPLGSRPVRAVPRGIEPRTTESRSEPLTQKTQTYVPELSLERPPTPVIWALGKLCVSRSTW